MLKFYDIDENYVKFLQSYDKQIPNIIYTSSSKFLCGIVLAINDCNYYAPVSSNTKIQRTSYPIKDPKGNIIASIRFCFMLPALESVILEKDFANIRTYDSPYADLLLKEWNDCQDNESAILSKA